MDLSTVVRSIEDVAALSKAAGAEVSKQIADILQHTTKSDARLLDLEQRVLTRGVGGAAGGGGALNLGQLIAGDAKLAAMRTGGSEKVTIPLNQSLRMITRSVLGNAGSTGATPAFEYATLPEMVPGGPRGFRGRRLAVLEALPHMTVNSAESAVPTLTGFTDVAGLQVHEGDVKPESTFNFANNILRHATIATFCSISRQLLSDAPLLEEFLNTIALYFVMRKLENLIVSGNGSTDQILGLTNAGAVYAPLTVPPHAVDLIADSIVALQSLGFTPDLVILSPTDYFAILTARDSNNRFIGPGWAAPQPGALWGVHTVVSAALPTGTGVVLDSSMVCILDRMEAQVLIGYQGTQFVQNLATILAEVRANLAVFDQHAVSVLTLPSLP
jgi:hypothetical protein